MQTTTRKSGSPAVARVEPTPKKEVRVSDPKKAPIQPPVQPVAPNQKPPAKKPTNTSKQKNSKDLIAVIDVGTRTIRFAIFKAKAVDELYSHQIDMERIMPQEGWVEQDPKVILDAIEACINEVMKQMEADEMGPKNIATVGICNARETTLAWDRTTGDHLYNAILWSDIRTNGMVDYVLAKFPVRNKNYLRPLCGLPVSSYYSALKMRWLIDNLRPVKNAMREKRLMIGTLDTWIVWNLTGGVNGGLYITDVTNASRTMLMNIKKLKWDPTLCKHFGIPKEILAKIKSSSEVYGYVKNGPLKDTPISGILGNQQAALVGQDCMEPGQAKNTYRRGCFLLCNTGDKLVLVTSSLETTVAYQLGPNQPPVYALEGAIAVAGTAIKWLRDNLKVIKDVHESEILAEHVFNTGDVYFVPAFHGLYAPYWRKDARGIICGITGYTTKEHVVRAALESICFQTKDIIKEMDKDGEIELTKLYTDGKMSENSLLMQLQADILGIPVYRSTVTEVSTLGAAKVAGNAVDLWNLNETETQSGGHEEFKPVATSNERTARYTKWKMAVQRSLGWVSSKNQLSDEKYRLLYTIPAAWFVLTSLVLFKISYVFHNR